MQLHINARSVLNHGNGVFTIEFPEQPLSPEDNQVLERLFPHLGGSIEELLSKEMLLHSLATSTDVELANKANGMPQRLEKNRSKT